MVSPFTPSWGQGDFRVCPRLSFVNMPITRPTYDRARTGCSPLIVAKADVPEGQRLGNQELLVARLANGTDMEGCDRRPDLGHGLQRPSQVPHS